MPRGKRTVTGQLCSPEVEVEVSVSGGDDDPASILVQSSFDEDDITSALLQLKGDRQSCENLFELAPQNQDGSDPAITLPAPSRQLRLLVDATHRVKKSRHRQSVDSTERSRAVKYRTVKTTATAAIPVAEALEESSDQLPSLTISQIPFPPIQIHLPQLAIVTPLQTHEPLETLDDIAKSIRAPKHYIVPILEPNIHTELKMEEILKPAETVIQQLLLQISSISAIQLFQRH